MESSLPAWKAVLNEVNDMLGSAYVLDRPLTGGEQDGAFLVRDADHIQVLKWQPAPDKARQLLRAFPAVAHAVSLGWPAARWTAAGALTAAPGAFSLQQFLEGEPMARIGRSEADAIVAANTQQAGCAFPHADDDVARIFAVLRGDLPWKSQVRSFSPAGKALVEHGEAVLAALGTTNLPVGDVTHGDYSIGNMLLQGGHVRFIDSETVKRGSRVRDLADLYRQLHVYPGGATQEGQDLLRQTACDIAGPDVFATCALAVTYDNLAWWVANKPRADFDVACNRLHGLFDELSTLANVDKAFRPSERRRASLDPTGAAAKKHPDPLRSPPYHPR